MFGLVLGKMLGLLLNKPLGPELHLMLGISVADKMVGSRVG